MTTFNDIRRHVGHNIEAVYYGDDVNAAIECTTCGEVIIDKDNPDKDNAQVNAIIEGAERKTGDNHE